MLEHDHVGICQCHRAEASCPGCNATCLLDVVQSSVAAMPRPRDIRSELVSYVYTTYTLCARCLGHGGIGSGTRTTAVAQALPVQASTSKHL